MSEKEDVKEIKKEKPVVIENDENGRIARDENGEIYFP